MADSPGSINVEATTRTDVTSSSAQVYEVPVFFAAADPHELENLDRMVRAATGRITRGVSPHAMAAAWFDWTSHLMRAPGRQIELAQRAYTNFARLSRYATKSMLGETPRAPFAPSANDHRFGAEDWRKQPYDLIAQSHLALAVC